MTSSASQTTPQPAVFGPLPRSAVSVVIVLALLLSAWLSLALLAPPTVEQGPQAPEAFSTERAIAHAQAIARQPHPIGSPENARVRDYLVSTLSGLGLETEVQSASALNTRTGVVFIGGRVENVVARLPGSANTRALVLMAHYDSVLGGPGANDDGAAVAALLEVARVLKAGPPLRNDVIFLLTDGEEAGLLGAQAFVQEPGRAAAVGVVANFEARGAGGPALLFETSPQNGELIRAFAQTPTLRFGSSLSYEVYRLLPNDTDFTLFRQAGIAGLNFAFIDDFTAYHSVTDNLEQLHVAGMQHHGEYALGLARVLGMRDLSSPQSVQADNVVYFDLLGRVLIIYPGWLALPLALLLALAWGAVVFQGRRAGVLTLGRTLLGALALLLALGLAVGLAALLAPLLGGLHPEFAAYGHTYEARGYLLGLTALAVAITAAVLGSLQRRVGPANLAVGALLWWVILALVCAALVPGASFLFTWPPLICLAGLAAVSATRDPEHGLERRWWVVLLCGLPGVLLCSPIVYQLAIALTLRLAAVAILVVVLVLGLLAPTLLLLMRPHRWRLPAAAALAGAVALVAGTLLDPRDGQHPAFDNVWYGLNADTGKAIWASGDAAPDAWTSQFIPAGSPHELAKDFFPTTTRRYLQTPAPTLDLPAPTIELLDDRVSGAERMLRVRVGSGRAAPLIWLYVGGAAVRRVEFEGLPAASVPASATPNAFDTWGLISWATPPEGLTLTLAIETGKAVRLTVVDRVSGLPENAAIQIRPRPEGLAPAPALADRFSNATLISKSLAIPAKP